jgi:hypothetical protein
MISDLEQTFVSELRCSLAKVIEDIANEEIRFAQERLERRIREKIAQATISVAQWAEITVMRDRLVVEIKSDKFKL